MAEQKMHLLRRIVFTLKHLRKVSEHHYGRSAFSIPKMIYHSVLSINTFVLFERKLDDALNPVSLSSEYTVVKPSRDELEAMRARNELPREFYYDRFHGVTNCYVVMHGPRPAYIHWIYIKGDANRFLRLGERVAEVNYITTLPEFRGKKLMARMMVLTMNDLKATGYKKLVSVVNTYNPPALKSMRAAGFKEVRKISAVGFLNRKYAVDE
jgi:RimJ/RimL family protein N-acetyltransferase